MIAMKPCPFCGMKPQWHIEEVLAFGRIPDSPWYQLECPHHDDMVVRTVYKQTRKEAIEVWNNRTRQKAKGG